MSGQINVNNERFSDVKKKNQKWMIQSRKGHHRLLLSKQQQEQFKGQ
jgi:hypothetical protein